MTWPLSGGAITLEGHGRAACVARGDRDEGSWSRTSESGDATLAIRTTSVSANGHPRSYNVSGFGDKYARDAVKSGTPLMFDSAFAPKPAFFAVQSGLRAP